MEAVVPEKYVGRSIQEIGFREHYEILVLTILKKTERDSLIGKSKIVTTVLHGIPKPDTVLQQGEIIVIYGDNRNIKEFLKR
ncbi:TrkA C-terminal domain-containing protein [Sphingobacterium hotanense]|uniref:TrkA C-terminal domain-containing protein n=1 Tax=Sphingobacterium hotanense TaxID=649196 RepID=UPI001CAA141D